MPILLLVLGLLPACRLKNALLCLVGSKWSIDRSARVAPTVLWRVDRVRLAAGTAIGPANVFREMVLVELAEEAVIGQFNWVTGEARYAEQDDPDQGGCLRLDRGAALTSRHYLDCAGGVRLEAMSILAGVRSTVLTHWADHRNWVLRAAPITLGPSTIVSSGVTLTAGAAVPHGSVVAAGAVVPKPLPEEGRFYAGVPAKAIADLSGSAHVARAEPKFAGADAAGRSRTPTSRH